MSVKDVKVVAIGDPQVGKTSMLMAHTSQCCSRSYRTNIFDTYSVKVIDGPTSVNLEVWDTSGQDCNFSAFPSIHHGVGVYLLCFALNSSTTYQNVKNKWFLEIQRCAPDVHIVLVGTKSDTRNKVGMEASGMVTQQMGIQLQEEINACAYIECAAIKSTGLVEVFEAVGRCASSVHVPPPSPDADLSKVLRSWLGSYADQYLYQEARQYGAEKRHLSSRLSTTLYLDSLRTDTLWVRSPPAWALVGTDIDRRVSGEALLRGARRQLLSKDETHAFLDAKRVAGVKVEAPPAWVVDDRTMKSFKDALARKIPPRKLNSRTETELFLLNIEDDARPVPDLLLCGMFGLNFAINPVTGVYSSQRGSQKNHN